MDKCKCWNSVGSSAPLVKDELIKSAFFSVNRSWRHTDLFSILLLQTLSPKWRKTPQKKVIYTWTDMVDGQNITCSFGAVLKMGVVYAGASGVCS